MWVISSYMVPYSRKQWHRANYFGVYVYAGRMSAKLSLTWAHEGRVSYVHILFISCDKVWTTFFMFSRIPFHILVCKVYNTHIKSVSQYCAKMKIIHSSGKMAGVFWGFTNPRVQILQAMSKYYGTWVWNFPYVSVVTPVFLWLLHDFVNVHAPQQQYCHSELSVETFRVLWCVLMQCFASNMHHFKTNNFLVNSHIACRILVLCIRK